MESPGESQLRMELNAAAELQAQLTDSQAEVRALRDIQNTLEMQLEHTRQNLRDAIRAQGQGSDPGKRAEQSRNAPTSGRGRVKELEKSLEVERIQHSREVNNFFAAPPNALVHENCKSDPVAAVCCGSRLHPTRHHDETTALTDRWSSFKLSSTNSRRTRLQLRQTERPPRVRMKPSCGSNQNG